MTSKLTYHLKSWAHSLRYSEGEKKSFFFLTPAFGVEYFTYNPNHTSLFGCSLYFLGLVPQLCPTRLDPMDRPRQAPLSKELSVENF